MTAATLAHRFRLLAAALLLAMLGACGALEKTRAAPPVFYALDSSQPSPAPRLTPATTRPTLLISPPQAAAGFDSRHIIYLREAHRLEYFAHAEWADTPARMIAPLLVGALAATERFAAVVLTPGSATGDLRLEVGIVRLQHEFAPSPSRVRLTLRAHLLDQKTRRVLAWREFDESVAAPQDTPYGGVIAANAAVHKVLGQLAAFAAAAAAGWSGPDAAGTGGRAD
ncbi:MAG: hypothetical protein CVU18_13370 [Betaproteobacteria bacterium HGW-Betaproteobacteria-12]|nr:MAG: hypothetical protein CVU18_13370 [Betaproteobacteria bacterium HGW-Betaproteobacteria-12]